MPIDFEKWRQEVDKAKKYREWVYKTIHDKTFKTKADGLLHVVTRKIEEALRKGGEH